MKESLNQVDITGIVSEINIRDIDKGNVKYVAGDVVVRVEEEKKDGTVEVSEIPVSFISADKKKDGTPNQNYARLQQLKDYNSIASAGEELATKVQIRGAKMNENLFMPQNGTDIISTARINSNFFTKVTNTNNFKPAATFRVIGKLLQIVDEQRNQDGDMVETGRLVIQAALVGYADKVEVIKFIVEDPTAISFIKANWKEGDTVQMGGRVRYTSETVEQEIESGFGENEVRSYTRRTREFVIERGSAEGLDEENSYSDDDIKAGLAVRKQRMEATKQAAQQPKAAPATTTSSNDFGF